MRTFFILAILLVSSIAKAQPMAFFDYKVFNNGEKTYVETYIDFYSESLNYGELPNQMFQAKVGTTIIITQNDQVVTYSKIDLFSPQTPDSVIQDFMDLQRFELKPGNYEIELQFVDLFKTDSNTTTHKQPLIVDIPANTAYVSDIVLLGDIKQATTQGPFTRGDKDLFPYVSDYFPKELNKLMFYAELYNTRLSFPDSTGAFVMMYRLASPKTGKTFRSYQKLTRQKAGKIIPVIGNIDISDLPSGEYNLVVEIKNTKNEPIAERKLTIKRSNPDVQVPDAEIEELMLNNSFVGTLANADTLGEYINSLRPIANDKDKSIIDKQKELLSSLEAKKRYFYTFWANQNPLDPAGAWSAYNEQVKEVQKMFGTRIKKGYETDRGRVWLEFGPPNTRTERPTEPSAYPYEIWHYYKIKQFSNKKFVFWNQDLAAQDYELLHSDMIGEIRNPNWQTYLVKRNNSIDNYDKRQGTKQFGGNADDYFRNPR